MPSPSPIIEDRLWIRIEIVRNFVSHAATPRESTIERTPTAIGSTEATTLPKATRRRSSVRGRTRISAERASAVLARRKSKLRGTSPVQPSQAFG